MSEQQQKLIICPQAGMCNRFRALSSLLFISEKLNRIPLIIWESLPESELILKGSIAPKDYMRMTNRNFSDFFEKTIDYANESDTVNLVLTEWLEDDEWYKIQSYGQRKFDCKYKKRLNNTFPNINRYDIVLVETSHKMIKYIDLEGNEQNIKNEDLFYIYNKYFIPNKRFISILNKIPNIDIGFSMRRGEFLHYYPETKYLYAIGNMALTEYLDEKTKGLESLLLFSDDYNYVPKMFKILSDRYPGKKIFNVMDIEYGIRDCKSWERPFIEFLILSFKCKQIYGTANSSYAEEAGIFGGKFHYNVLMS